MATLRKIKMDIAKHYSLESSTALRKIFDSGWHPGKNPDRFNTEKYRHVHFSHPSNARRMICVSMDSRGGANVYVANKA